jgi:hypothetical protein
MNPINLISSTLALGAMIGITGSHFQQVQSMVENASHASPIPLGMAEVVSPVYEVKSEALRLPMSQAPTSGLSKKELPKTTSSKLSGIALDDRDSALMEILIAIRNEQKNMRAQLGDTNRNMDELTFRVDTYSTQFRPLQTEIRRPRALVVPDDDYSPPVGGGQLLPPKP